MKDNHNPKTGNRRRPPRKPQREETVYTEVKPINMTRFLVRIATVVAVVLALVFAMSIFFHVKNVEIAGAEKYTLAQIQEASGITKGENLLTLNKGKVAGRILTKLPYISSVRIAIRLPDTVVIEVTESAVAYAAQDGDDAWWLLSAQGKVLEKITSAQAADYTHIQGVLLDTPKAGSQASALEIPPVGTDGETLPVTIYQRERLSTALKVASEMEKNGVLGRLVSIDVEDMGDITVWYEKRYEIHLGVQEEIPKKVFSVVQAISQLGDYQTGVLDASFTTWPNEVYHKSFD